MTRPCARVLGQWSHVSTRSSINVISEASVFGPGPKNAANMPRLPGNAQNISRSFNDLNDGGNSVDLQICQNNAGHECGRKPLLTRHAILLLPGDERLASHRIISSLPFLSLKIIFNYILEVQEVASF